MALRVQYYHFMKILLLQNHCSNFKGSKIIQNLRKFLAILGQARTHMGSPNHVVALGGTQNCVFWMGKCLEKQKNMILTSPQGDNIFDFALS